MPDITDVTGAGDAIGTAPLVTWLPSRTQTSLNGEWKAIIDVYGIGVGGSPFSDDPRWGFAADRGMSSPGRRAEYDFDLADGVVVPGDWNTQRERWHFYEGAMWFRRRFATPPERDGRRFVLHVGAANHRASVYLNGTLVGEHEGGYGPFCIEVTDELRADGAENALVVRVDNTRRVEAVPTTHTDWFNYGGLIRDVTLLDLPTTFIRDAVVQLDPSDPGSVAVDVQLDGGRLEQKVTVSVAGRELGELHTDADGRASGRLGFPSDLSLWSPDDPLLHEVEVRAETDTVADRIGFRTVATDGARILLNGQPVFLAGISLHDEALGEPARRIRTRDEARAVLEEAVAVGANFVRLAHYQHHEQTVRLCDELGLLAWCEVPVYWGIAWDDDATFENARAQLTELVVRDRNRAAVILWSVANETRSTPERNQFLTGLVRTVRSLDPTRLVTAALFARPADDDFRGAFLGTSDADWVVDDPLGEHLDVLGVNQYHGWYYGTFDAMASMTWTSPYDKPLVMSEFGGGARAGRRGPVDEDWTEDHQAEIYRHQFAMLSRIPFLAGTTPWILKDFRAPFRVLAGIQDGFNRKGLVDPEGRRKLAFAVVREWNLGRR